MTNNTTAACGSTLEERVAALEADAAVLQALHERVAALEAGKAVAKTVKGKAAPKVAKEKAVLSLSPSDDMGRMNAADIDEDLCQARRLPDETLPGYTPKVYREAQCTKPKKEGDLCGSCNKAFEKATELGDEFACHKAGHPKWWGLITEEPHPTCHMLGTAWAEKKVTKVDADNASSDSGSSEQMKAEKAAKAAAAKAEKAAKAAAAKAEKAATKEAEKAEKAAAKEAEKAAKAAAKAEKPKTKATKPKAKEAEAESVAESESEAESVAESVEVDAEAEKAAAEAAKAAAKAAAAKEKAAKEKAKEKATKPKAEKAEKAEKTKAKAKGKKPDVMPAKAADEEVKETYEPWCWDDVLYLKKSNGDCYESDEATQSIPVKYAGHVTDDGMLDTTIPEQKAAESDSE